METQGNPNSLFASIRVRECARNEGMNESLRRSGGLARHKTSVRIARRLEVFPVRLRFERSENRIENASFEVVHCLAGIGIPDESAAKELDLVASSSISHLHHS